MRQRGTSVIPSTLSNPEFLLHMAHDAGIVCKSVMLLEEEVLFDSEGEMTINLFEQNSFALHFKIETDDPRGDLACYTVHPIPTAFELLDPAIWQQIQELVDATCARVLASDVS